MPQIIIKSDLGLTNEINSVKIFKPCLVACSLYSTESKKKTVGKLFLFVSPLLLYHREYIVCLSQIKLKSHKNSLVSQYNINLFIENFLFREVASHSTLKHVSLFCALPRSLPDFTFDLKPFDNTLALLPAPPPPLCRPHENTMTTRTSLIPVLVIHFQISILKSHKITKK